MELVDTVGEALTSSPIRNDAISARVIASSGLKAPPEEIMPLEASRLMASWASAQTPPMSENPASMASPRSTPAASAARAITTAISARVTSWFGEYVEPSPVPLVTS